MNRPEDDPVVVALVASNLLGRYCQDWPTALVQARRGLELSQQLIEAERIRQGIDDEDREFYVREGLQDWIGERAFVEELSKGLVRSKRSDRKKALVTKYWTILRECFSAAPPIEDEYSWTLTTLHRWQPYFAMIWRVQRSEASSENRRRGHARIRAKKSA
jgi:hypothetical protein